MVNVLPLPEILAEPAATTPPRGLADSLGGAHEAMIRLTNKMGRPHGFSSNCKFITPRVFPSDF
jgi:hypothetical protein